MIRGLYSAATALEAASTHQDVIANNIAHATVAGYRQRGVAFETFDQALSQATISGRPTVDIIGTQISKGFSNFQGGPIMFTGNPLDVAIGGDAFFAVEGPNGPLYTRNGSFQINVEGTLLTQSGMTVTGTGGPITIPPNTAQVNITQDGTVFADNNLAGQLQLTRFTDPENLTPVGTTLFAAGTATPAEDTTSSVQQGYRENSNVLVVDEMVAMIAGQRYYDAAQRALRSLSDALQQNTRAQA